jgi:hypothetical protein
MVRRLFAQLYQAARGTTSKFEGYNKELDLFNSRRLGLASRARFIP